VNPVLEREDVDASLSGIFDINAKLSRIDENLETIAVWLREDEDEEEEEDGAPGDAS
jgi:hypothetical protein